MTSLPHDMAQPLAFFLLTPFVAVFVWAAWVEVRRWWRHGPARDRRALFVIDKSAPSYQPPPERATRPDARP